MDSQAIKDTGGSSLTRVPLTTVEMSNSGIEIEDVVVALFGFKHPLILRRKNDRCVLISETYHHGFMKSEATGMFREEEHR